MQDDQEMRCVETAHGFEIQHKVTVPSGRREPLTVQCSHFFLEKILLEQIQANLSKSSGSQIEQLHSLNEAHDLALCEANHHILSYGSESLLKGSSQELHVGKDFMKFTDDYWDDGNEYRGISPSSSRETWDIPTAIFGSFLDELGVKSIVDLLLLVEGPEHIKAVQKLKTFAEQNDFYNSKRTL